jgi:hypothetical protein
MVEVMGVLLLVALRHHCISMKAVDANLEMDYERSGEVIKVGGIGV